MMPPLITIAAKSAWNRRASLSLTVIAVALSVLMLLGVERLRHAVRAGFEQSASGTDLIVGPRGSALQLMLYAVFRMGEATHNMRWSSVQSLEQHPAIAWVVPLSLGDSHRGFPVLATTAPYFEHFRYGTGRHLQFTQGYPFGSDGVFDTVLGAEVAQSLGYGLGSRLTLSHGGGTFAAAHEDKPFHVVGILARTGTPVDRTVHINLTGMEAIHLDWQGGAPMPGVTIPAEHVKKFDLTPKFVTAALLGLESRAAVFVVQHHVNEFEPEPLMAVLPGVVLSQLWQVIGHGERALFGVAAFVVVVGLAGLVAAVLAGLNERRRELAILRAAGARPLDIFWLLSAEGLGLTFVGAALGFILLTVLSLFSAPILEARLGLTVPAAAPTATEFTLLACVIVAGVFASLLPGWRAYRMSLADGLTPRT